MPFEPLQLQMLLPAFGLVVARVAGIAMALPILTNASLPRVVVAWLVVMISLCAFPIVAPTLPQSLSLSQAAVGMVGELLIGEVLGLGAGAVIMAAQVAGKVISHQSAMALVAVFNPMIDDESTVLEQLWFLTIVGVFLALRGHLAVMQVLLDSFRQVPPMFFHADASFEEFLRALMRSMFETALGLSGPVILALLLTSLIMGFLAKTMPQLNIFSVGFSFKIATALLMLAITIGFAQERIADAMADGLELVEALFARFSNEVIRGG